MGRIRAIIALAAAVAAAAILVSGDSSSDPRTPPPLPGLPSPFLGTAVAGNGGLTAAVDSYGAVVDLRPQGPAGAPSIAVSAARQSAGSVPSGTGIVPRAAAGGGPALPLWRADWVRQRYVRGSNVVRTSARVAGANVEILDSVPPPGDALVRTFEVEAPARRAVVLRVSVEHGGRPGCRGGGWHGRGRLRVRMVCSFASASPSIAAPVRRAVAADRRWLARARPLGAAAPQWARQMYSRALLVLRALTDSSSGAVAAGARDGWAYVWPRDAAAVALALARAGYRAEASRVARFLLRLDAGEAARFRGDGAPVGGRGPSGDAGGWIRLAARAVGLPAPAANRPGWRGRGDYTERAGEGGDYLANAIAAGVPAPRIRAAFERGGVLVRRAGDPGSGLDSAAAWAVRPFPRPALFGAVRKSLHRLLGARGGYGIEPTGDWPGDEPWTAPTAWTAWSLAALGERREAIALLADLRRAATTAGTLPERVGAGNGLARSTTPLAWSHAFAALALQQLWPPR